MRSGLGWLYARQWPLPAVLVWLLCWAVFQLALAWQLDWAVSAGVATLLGWLLAAGAPSRSRRWWVGLGFPVLMLAAWAAQHQWLLIPGWVWLLPVAALLLLYPLGAWRDAPLFPTPVGVLDDLPTVAALEPGSAVLDAGCGLGHGLDALRRAYPLARWHGVEKSRLLAWWCQRRCRWAQVHCADMWQHDWSGYALVYVFQRPESMPGVWQKACRELPAGAWLVSLEFVVPDVQAVAQIECEDGKMVWVYTTPQPATPQTL